METILLIIILLLEILHYFVSVTNHKSHDAGIASIDRKTDNLSLLQNKIAPIAADKLIEFKALGKIEDAKQYLDTEIIHMILHVVRTSKDSNDAYRVWMHYNYPSYIKRYYEYIGIDDVPHDLYEINFEKYFLQREFLTKEPNIRFHVKK